MILRERKTNIPYIAKYLDSKREGCYTINGKSEEYATWKHKTKPPAGIDCWGFLLLFQSSQPGLITELLLLAIQPLAYVVGNYTCHDGQKKREEYLHRKHPFPATDCARSER